jgi:phosphoesterase RecJ-like protein
MTSDDRFRKINELIERSSSILVAGHEMPDGDSMSSALALSSILRRLGKEVTLFNEDWFPFNYMFLKDSESAVRKLPQKAPDLFIIVDCGSPERVSKSLYEMMEKSSSPKILFDHHVENEKSRKFFDEVYIDTLACATAAIIYRWSIASGIELSNDEAEAIYAGIVSDTGGLKYGSTNRESFLILAELVEKVDPWEISSKIFENVPLEQLKMLSEVLADLRMIAGGKGSVIKITLDQFKRYGLNPDHIDSFVNFARSIKGVNIAVRFREKEKDVWKVSMRSSGDIDANRISAGFGGGGHRNAAGFVFKGTFEEGLKKIEEIVQSVSN